MTVKNRSTSPVGGESSPASLRITAGVTLTMLSAGGKPWGTSPLHTSRVCAFTSLQLAATSVSGATPVNSNRCVSSRYPRLVRSFTQCLTASHEITLLPPFMYTCVTLQFVTSGPPYVLEVLVMLAPAAGGNAPGTSAETDMLSAPRRRVLVRGPATWRQYLLLPPSKADHCLWRSMRVSRAQMEVRVASDANADPLVGCCTWRHQQPLAMH
jgi:hypothetical protein